MANRLKKKVFPNKKVLRSPYIDVILALISIFTCVLALTIFFLDYN